MSNNKDTSSSTCGKQEEKPRESTTHGLMPCGKLVEKVVENLCKEELERKLLIFPVDKARSRD